MKQYFKKILLFFVALLPEDAPRFIYTTLLKPKIFRNATNFIICRLIGEKVSIPEGYIALNKKDPVVSGSLALGCYEGTESQLIREKIKEGMTVIDVGANIGYFSVIASSIVGDNGRVISFEPDKENFEFLEKTIELNNFKNVTPCNVALSDKNGEIELFISEDNKGDHRIYATTEKRASIKVKTFTMDDYLDSLDIKKVDFIKIDVQGVEWLVLMGMHKTISNNPKISILLEFWPHGIIESGGHPVSFLNMLKIAGLNIFGVNQQSGDLEFISGYETFINRIKNKEYVNLYCTKETI